MTIEKPRCFIAMAFGFEDTDAIYDRYIEPIVTKCGFMPRRVDRILFNDYIDRKIIEEISKASICITDLTYARQSVYFEAGFAAREIPVLYTCRKDHFNNTKDEEKVHFDLRQRNIIGWKNKNDISFNKRLKKRFNLLARPIIQNNIQNIKLEEERNKFSRLSAIKKLGQIHEALKTLLTQYSFERTTYKPSFLVEYSQVDPEFLKTWSFYFKKNKNELILLHDIFLESIDAKMMNRLWRIENYHLDDLIKEKVTKEIKNIRNVNLIIYLNNIKSSFINKSLPTYNNPFDNYFLIDASRKIIFNKRQIVSLKSEYLFFDKVKSISEFSKNLNEILKKINLIK